MLSPSTLESSVKSWPVGPELHPSFDASSPLDCSGQSHEILLHNGMKCSDSGLNARGLRGFIDTVSDLLKALRKKRTGQTRIRSKCGANLSFNPP